MLFVLELEERERMSLAALPIDKLHWSYLNAHRDPGEVDQDGRVVRAPAQAIDFETVRTFSSHKRLVPESKTEEDDPNWDYSLQGAKANRQQFEAWAGVKNHAVFIPTKE